MVCMECGAKAEKGYTTSVTDLGNCLLIVRNVPCYKCTECNEIIYTGDVIILASILICQMICFYFNNSVNLLANHFAHGYKRLEQITEQAKQFTQEISIVNYSSAA